MPSTYAAVKSQMGDINYYIIAMPAQELVNTVIFPDFQKDPSVQEVYQRELNNKRVMSEIAPYLAENDDRFMGAVILAAEGLTDQSFVPVDEIVDEKLKPPYIELTKQIGFINLSGEEIIHILDGQHRIKALPYALKGIKGQFEPNPDVAKDKITVILISYEYERARRIFTKVNRYAKPPSAGQVLVTDDDDLVAVIAREIAEKYISVRMTNIKGNSVTGKDVYFTTLPTIAEGTYSILNHCHNIVRKDRKKMPSKRKLKVYRDKAFEYWAMLLEGVDEWNAALADKRPEGDKERKIQKKDYLHMRPIPQRCIIEAFCNVVEVENSIDPVLALKRLNDIPWEFNAKLWDRVLLAGNKIQTKNVTLVTQMLIYILQGYEIKNKATLETEYQKMFPEKVKLAQIEKFAEMKSSEI